MYNRCVKGQNQIIERVKNLTDFGRFIRKARESKGLSVTAVAEQVGINHSHLSRIENGDRNPPKIPTILKLSQVLEIPFNELMEKAGHLNGLGEKEKEEIGQTVSATTSFLDDSIIHFLELIGNSIIYHKPFSERIERELWNGLEEIVTRFRAEVEFKISVTDPDRFEKLAKSINKNEDAVFKSALLNSLKNLASKYHLWEDTNSISKTSPDPYKNEKELISKIELSDEELLKQFEFELDGRPLTEKEIKRLLAYVRAERSLE